MTVYPTRQLPTEPCPKREIHEPHDHSPVASKHCPGLDPTVMAPTDDLQRTIERMVGLYGKWRVGAEIDKHPNPHATPDEIEADRRWVEQALQGKHTHRGDSGIYTGPEDEDCDICHPKRDAMLDLRVYWTGETSDMCDWDDCTNFSTHDVHTNHAAHRSCTKHLRDMITV